MHRATASRSTAAMVDGRAGSSGTLIDAFTQAASSALRTDSGVPALT